MVPGHRSKEYSLYLLFGPTGHILKSTIVYNDRKLKLLFGKNKNKPSNALKPFLSDFYLIILCA